MSHACCAVLTISTDLPNNINTIVKIENEKLDIPSITIRRMESMECPDSRLSSLFVQLPNESFTRMDHPT